MANANLVELTDANFENEVLKSDKPVLVDFWADWCQPCKMLTPTIEKLATNFAGKAKVGKINTDNARNTAIKYGINAIPTVILFNNGQPVQKWVGLNGEKAYSEALQPLVK